MSANHEHTELAAELRQWAGHFPNTYTVYVAAADAIDALAGELAQSRETAKRLNRRAQAAEKAAEDAHECIRRVNNGAPWCGGNLGRALLSHHCGKLEERLARAERVVDLSRRAVESGAVDELYLTLMRDALAGHDNPAPVGAAKEGA